MGKPRIDSENISIRMAREEDIPGLIGCLGAAFEEFRSRYTVGAFEDTVLTPESVRQRLKEMTIFVAVDSGGQVVGTIASQVVLVNEGHLRGMAVLPRLHGAGLAQRLLERAEEHLGEKGCARITLDTTEPLERAMRFYERNGYRRSGKEQGFFGMRLMEYEKPVLSPYDQANLDAPLSG